MEKRRLGRSGLEVSAIGFGAWGIGGSMWIGANDDDSLRALHRAIDLGVNFVDTAIVYGQGRSEEIVGKLVRERREPVCVATKVPAKNLKWPATGSLAEAFPPEHVARFCEKSLRNLGRDSVELLQLHVWRDAWLDDPLWGETHASLQALQRSGKARFIGVSLTEHAPDSGLRAVASGAFDAVQVIYNIFDQAPEAALFPACLRHDVGVLARVPLDEGGLTGQVKPDSVFPPDDFRNSYFAGSRRREVFERCERLEALLGAEARTLPELALRFCLSAAAVSSVIPGMRRVASVEASAACGDGRRLSPGLLASLKAHAWPRNFYS